MSTSQPVRVRPPLRPAHDPDGRAQERRPATYGRPRRRRESRRALARVALAVVPLVAAAWIGHTVIEGYQARTSEPATAGASDPAASATGAAERHADDHAPKGPDVGTEGLTAGMARAVTRARTAAARDGITIDIVSGARSAATQQRLYDEAIVTYGSAEAASKWVLPPAKSAHVSGRAVDVGPYAAAQWLEQHGVRFGLCRRYLNEYWHFELLAPAKGQACPPMVADASAG